MASARILVVDDEQSIIDLVTAYLRREGYEVHTAMDGPSGLRAARAFKPDLIVLDVMLPGMDGLEVLARLRRESDVYIIMLTARSEETDKIVGLSVGADDHLTKPFSPRELVARVKAALRRLHSGVGTTETTTLAFRHVRLDTGRRQVWVDDEPVELTSTQFELLKTLVEHRGLVLSREQLLEKVWGWEWIDDLDSLRIYIWHLRQKIEPDPGKPKYILTEAGVGYRFDKAK